MLWSDKKTTTCCERASYFYHGGSTVPGMGAQIPTEPAQGANTLGASTPGSIFFGANYIGFTSLRKACSL